MASKITYTRGTAYYLTVNYTGIVYPGTSAIFTAKTVAFDADDTDAVNAIFTPKTITLTGSAPATGVFKISGGDVPLTIAPANNYYFSVKVIDSNGDPYIASSGTFVLEAVTTNEV